MGLVTWSFLTTLFFYGNIEGMANHKDYCFYIFEHEGDKSKEEGNDSKNKFLKWKIMIWYNFKSNIIEYFLSIFSIANSTSDANDTTDK